LRKAALNLIGPQVRKWRTKRGWSQEALAVRLQLRGWNVGRDSLANLESQRRRVPDCELIFLAKVLGVSLAELFPKNISLKTVGPRFRSGDRLAVFPARGEK
jgi:transcriptional regulator with XRE-family HTH domain